MHLLLVVLVTSLFNLFYPLQRVFKLQEAILCDLDDPSLVHVNSGTET